MNAPKPVTKSSASATEPEVITFGCRLNAFESEVIRGHAREAGAGSRIIVNTCAVTAEATRQARQAIRRARRENPAAQIVVTGCAAQIEPARFAAMPEVDRVIGNAEKLRAESYAEIGADGAVAVADIFAERDPRTAPPLIKGFEGRARAFVEVQTGCDHRCSFCIIPYGRGNSRSVPVAAVVEQVARLVDGGCNEIVLSGVDITSYGEDLPGRPPLGTLVQTILAEVPELKRLRLSSLDVIEVDDALMDVVCGDERLLPHLHLSLQSGDDMILKRMKRRHSRDDAIAFCARVRAARPDMTFGADLIAGFPTETEAMFENSLQLVEDCDIAFLHVFPYSERPGTPAAKMPQVEKAARKERARLLREAGNDQKRQLFKAMASWQVDALIEQQAPDGNWRARSDHYAPVEVAARPHYALDSGAVVRLRVTGLVDESSEPLLTGELADG